MNEYDSSKMADLLGVHGGYVLTEDEESADLLLAQYLLNQGKGSGKGVPPIGSLEKAEETNPALK